jgi:hypothetical protein
MKDPLSTCRQTPEDYLDRLSEAAKEAGGMSDQWNQRFVAALRKLRLQLGPAPARWVKAMPDDRYPGGFPLQAPLPFSSPIAAWPAETAVTWIPGAES